MGTRSITTVTSSWHNGEPQVNATIYRHWDGYIAGGHGEWLAEFLADAVVTNGRQDKQKHYNGPGELASAIVEALRADDHNPNLVPAGSIMGQEYEYQVHVDYGLDGGRVSLRVFDGPMTAFGGGSENCNNLVFSGTVAEFAAFVAKEAT